MNLRHRALRIADSPPLLKARTLLDGALTAGSRTTTSTLTTRKL